MPQKRRSGVVEPAISTTPTSVPSFTEIAGIQRVVPEVARSFRADSPARWPWPPLLGSPIPVMLKTDESEIFGARRATHCIRLHVVDLYQMPGPAAPSTLRIAIRAPSPVPDPDVPLHRRWDRPRDGRPHPPEGLPVAAGRLWVVRLGRPSTTTLNRRRRRGIVQATISCSRGQRRVMAAAINCSRRRRGLVRPRRSGPCRRCGLVRATTNGSQHRGVMAAAINCSRRRRGTVRASISCSRRRRSLVRTTFSARRRVQLATLAVGAGALRIALHHTVSRRCCRANLLSPHPGRAPGRVVLRQAVGHQPLQQLPVLHRRVDVRQQVAQLLQPALAVPVNYRLQLPAVSPQRPQPIPRAHQLGIHRRDQLTDLARRLPLRLLDQVPLDALAQRRPRCSRVYSFYSFSCCARCARFACCSRFSCRSGFSRCARVSCCCGCSACSSCARFSGSPFSSCASLFPLGGHCGLAGTVRPAQSAHTAGTTGTTGTVRPAHTTRLSPALLPRPLPLPLPPRMPLERTLQLPGSGQRQRPLLKLLCCRPAQDSTTRQPAFPQRAKR